MSRATSRRGPFQRARARLSRRARTAKAPRPDSSRRSARPAGKASGPRLHFLEQAGRRRSPRPSSVAGDAAQVTARQQRTFPPGAATSAATSRGLVPGRRYGPGRPSAPTRPARCSIQPTVLSRSQGPRELPAVDDAQRHGRGYYRNAYTAEAGQRVARRRLVARSWTERRRGVSRCSRRRRHGKLRSSRALDACPSCSSGQDPFTVGPAIGLRSHRRMVPTDLRPQ